MAQGIVKYVKQNAEKVAKSGKTFKGAELSFITNGKTKTEFIFGSSKFIELVRSLSEGDKIEAKYEQNGGYWNLVDVTLLEKSSGVSQSESSTSNAATSKASYGKEEPEKQASIQRQNALTNAVSIVKAAVEQGIYKKSTSPELLIQETLRIAKEFTAFNSGTLQENELKVDTSAIVTTEPTGDDDDIPF